MAAVDRAVAILEALADKSLTNPQMVGIVENFINYREVDDLTGEEKAQEFVDRLFLLVKRKVRAGATNKAHEDNAATVIAAGETAVVDL